MTSARVPTAGPLASSEVLMVSATSVAVANTVPGSGATRNAGLAAARPSCARGPRRVSASAGRPPGRAQPAPGAGPADGVAQSTHTYPCVCVSTKCAV